MFRAVKNTFSDVLKIYKNFFLWFKIKLISSIFWIILWIILVLPIILISLFYSWYFQVDPSSFSNWTFWKDNFLNLSLIIIYFLFILSFLYSYFVIWIFIENILKNKQKEKFIVYKNFFNKNNIKKYFKITIIFILFFIIISLFWIFIINIVKNIYWLDWAIKETWKWILNVFSIIFIFILIFTFYIIYRFSFSYLITIKENSNILEAFKKSFNMTKWINKLIKTFVILALFLTMYFPFYSIKSNFETDKYNIQIYWNMLKNWVKKWEERNFDYLKLKYWTENLKEIEKKFIDTNRIIDIINIIYYILFFSFWTIIYISIFNNIIKK